ncbi:hypothetical protein CDV55_106923 [Aspergillus turcosus]|nr:hypothetical protein CDV55_106923 [Aspergillus turcosus]
MKTILVAGATGNQGGSVAKLLLKYPEQYTVRCLTRDPTSANAKALAEQGAEIVQGDLGKPSTLSGALEGCWGVFAVTNFYDSTISNDPMSEEQQGCNLAKAALDAGVQCYIWSTQPSVTRLSRGEFSTPLCDGKSRVDDYIREIGLQSVFIATGNFYENLVLRGHVSYDKETDTIMYRHAILKPDAQMSMLYVEKDLSALVKAVFDQWDERKDELTEKYLYVGSAPSTPMDVVAAIEKASGKKCNYVVLPTSTGVKERDTMIHFYNTFGMRPGIMLPDPEVLKLGVKLHSTDDYVRERLLPHLGLEVVN